MSPFTKACPFTAAAAASLVSFALDFGLCLATPALAGGSAAFEGGAAAVAAGDGAVASSVEGANSAAAAIGVDSRVVARVVFVLSGKGCFLGLPMGLGLFAAGTCVRCRCEHSQWFASIALAPFVSVSLLSLHLSPITVSELWLNRPVHRLSPLSPAQCLPSRAVAVVAAQLPLFLKQQHARHSWVRPPPRQQMQVLMLQQALESAHWTAASWFVSS